MAAKIRVYELARDLNMTSKVLLGKLKNMNINVGSHVSSLDDKTVAMIRGTVFGDKAESNRTRPTVIRRRKKKAPPTDIPEIVPEETIEQETGPETTETVDGTLEAPVEPEASAEEMTESETRDDVAEKAGITDPETGEETKPVVGEAEETRIEKEKKVKNARRRIKDEPAKIISIREVEAPVEVAETVEAAETNAEEAEVDAKVAEAVETDTKVAEEVEADAKVAEAVEAEAEEADTTVAEPEISDEPAKTTEKPPVQAKPEKQKSGKSRKRSKKLKKEFPAKIIKLPTPEEKKPEPEKPRLEATKSEPEPRRESNTPKTPSENAASDSKDKKKRKTKRGAENTDKEKKPKEVKWARKKISFRRKEVIEGDALYSSGPRGRKGRKGAKIKTVQSQKPLITTPKAIKRRIKIDETIIVSELAKRMGIKAGEMIARLITMGVMVTVNQTIDFDTAVLVAAEFDYEVERASFEEEVLLKVEKADPEKLEFRPPVVTIMGHVDHGKTSLLDVIRKTRITESEAGGITQHIGAYHVSTENGQLVFLDTPGHEAFTSMRARGAKITDIVVLVVAADDGVMPQTVEAINHSKAAEVPIIVAVNKIDKANADIDRVYRELSEQGLVPEDWGGDTIFVKVSAKQNTGIDDLLEMIVLQSEVLELKADPEKHATGYVVESKLDSGRGPVATVLIQEGTLNAGDSVVCGIHHGKIRAMLNDVGVQVESAGPSLPVEILGLSGVPNAGDEFVALDDEKSAKQVSTHRIQKHRSRELAKTSRLSLDSLFERIQEGEIKDLNLILKADVHGSIEALSDSLIKLSNDEVTINIIHSATGTIIESDIPLATVSNAIIIGFNVRPSGKVQALAGEENVDMRFYNVIYDVIRDVKDAILGMMSSTYEERIMGRAEVRQVFHVPKIGSIAGSYLTDGKIERGCLVRLLREGVVIYDGKLGSLRRFKDDVKEVQSGYECGIGIENFNDIKVGDIIECYYLEEIKPEL